MNNKLENIAKINFKYVAVRKRCVTEEVKISYNKLKAIVDMANDYIRILNNRVESFSENDTYLRARFNFQIKELQEISELIAEALQYNPNCEIKRKRKTRLQDETGLDPLESLALKRR